MCLAFESSMLSCRFEMLFPHKVCILLMKTIPDSLGIRNIRLGTVNLSNSLHIGNKTEILLYWKWCYAIILLYLSMCVCTCAQLYLTHCGSTDWSLLGSSIHGISLQEYWSGCRFLLQGIFPTQVLNQCLLHLLHWQAEFFFLPLSHLESTFSEYVIAPLCNRRWFHPHGKNGRENKRKNIFIILDSVCVTTNNVI